MRKYYIFSAILSGLTFLVILGAFGIMGNPFETKKRNNDNLRSSALQSLKYPIESYYSSNNNTLPKSLNDSELNSIVYNKTDPVTGEEYEYFPLQNGAYRLCATFETDTTKQNTDKTRYYNNYDNPNFYLHAKGRVCFNSKVTSYVKSEVKPVEQPFKYYNKGDSDPKKDEIVEGVISSKYTDPSGNYIVSLTLGGDNTARDIAPNYGTTGNMGTTYAFDENTKVYVTNEKGVIIEGTHKDLHVKENVKIQYGYTATGMYYARMVTKLD